MKKILLLLSLLLIAPFANAGTIDLNSYISGNDVQISALNDDNTTLENVINGNISGGVNILQNSLVSQDMAVSISPVTRWDEAFNDFTISGMLPPTDASLTSIISAGTSYINGIRVTKSATSNTYTASKDTYAYIHEGVYYIFSEVANGAAAPSTPSDSLLLAKVVTSGSAITSVTDLRTTSIQITATASNFPSDYREQASISSDSSTTFHIEPGHIAIGTLIYSNTANTSIKTLSTATDWIESGPPNLTEPKKFYMYAFNNSGTAFDMKFSSADPAFSDTAENTAGTLRYYKSGGITYRAVAWGYVSADAVTDYAYSNFADKGIKNKVRYERNDVAVLPVVFPSDDDTIPQSNEGTEAFQLQFVPSNPNSQIKISGIVHLNQTGGNPHLTNALFRGSNVNASCISHVFQGTAGVINPLPLNCEEIAGTNDVITYKVRSGGTSSATMNGKSTTRTFGGVLRSYIEIEEIL